MDPGIDDKDVLSAANQQGTILLTADKDLGELAIREHESELSDAFSVVSPGMFRIRRRT